MALHEHALRVAAVEHRGREEERATRNDTLRRLHVGNDLLLRLAGACREPGQSERRAHQRQELAAAEGIVEHRRLLGELAPQHLLHRGVAGQLLQALPVRAAVHALQTAPHALQRDRHGSHSIARVARHRWQVEQLVRVWMPYSLTSRAPSAS